MNKNIKLVIGSICIIIWGIFMIITTFLDQNISLWLLIAFVPMSILIYRYINKDELNEMKVLVDISNDNTITNEEKLTKIEGAIMNLTNKWIQKSKEIQEPITYNTEVKTDIPKEGDFLSFVGEDLYMFKHELEAQRQQQQEKYDFLPLMASIFQISKQNRGVDPLLMSSMLSLSKSVGKEIKKRKRSRGALIEVRKDKGEEEDIET